MEAHGEKEMDEGMAGDLLGEGGVLQSGQETAVKMATEEAQASFAANLAEAEGGKTKKIKPNNRESGGTEHLVPKTPLEQGA